MADSTPWYRTRPGIAVVAVYAALTLLAIALSTGELLAGTFFPAGSEAGAGGANTPTPTGASAPSDDGTSMTVPPHVYLYAFLGAMAYAFTSLVAKFERGVEGVVRVGIRAVAALPLAAGVYLLAGALGLPNEGGLVAGVAFLVGLYVNLTLKALGGLADRLYGGPGRDDAAAGRRRPAERAAAPDEPDAGQPTSSGTVTDGAGDPRA